jgi:phosphoglycolate phosphatase
MKKNLKLYLFDLDGTLIDSADDIVEAVNYSLKKLGFQPLPKEEIIKHVGYGARNLMKDVLKVNDEDLIDKATKLFREYYLSHPVVYTKPYPYIPETLELIKQKGLFTGVVTNKIASVSEKILKKLGLIKWIDVLVGAETTLEKKPSPKPVLYVLEKLNISNENTILIGDSEVDIQAGKNARTYTGLVLYGYGKVDLALAENPDFIFKTPKDVYEFVRTI